MKKKLMIQIFPVLLIVLLTLACGSVQIGVVTPTFENELVSLDDEQAPTPEFEVIETSQPTDESEEERGDSTLATAYLAYEGLDNNLWVLDSGSLAPRQLTFDANLVGNGSLEVVYSYPLLSSDGTLLAYYRNVGTPSTSGYGYTYGVWVVNLVTGEVRQILASRASGMAWKPGTHILAYGNQIDDEYFMFPGNPDTGLATGISTINLDSGEILELVAPVRGYALVSPNWSPDGRFLAFSEVDNMEGSGRFAYYDLENQEYIAWDEKVGNTSWSPDGSLLTYSRQTYVATGEERLYLRQRQGGEQLLGPDYDGPAYATEPVFSPSGNQIAYLAFLDGPEMYTATVMVLDLAGGEPKPLGRFEDLWELAWAPDGSHLVFSFGVHPNRQIIALDISDGSQTVLADGTVPSLAGRQ